MTDKYKYTFHEVELADLPANEDILGPEPDREFLMTVQNYGIIYPIILTVYEGQTYLIDGGRRIKAARYFEYNTITAQIYSEVSPFDQAAWSVLLNQQRSVNPIMEYHYLSQLREEDWPKFIEATRINKAHIKKIMSLDNLDPDVRSTFFEGYSDGKIAEGTLFDVAKQSQPRQVYLKTVMDAKGNLTGTDVREAKQAGTQAILAANEHLFDEVEQPTDVTTTEYMFVAIQKMGDHAISGPFYDFHSAHEWALANGAKLYRLVEV